MGGNSKKSEKCAKFSKTDWRLIGTSTWNICRDDLFLYKLRRIQPLWEDELEGCCGFARDRLWRAVRMSRMSHDEAHFHSEGYVNKQIPRLVTDAF